jgi:hypothetical protein
VPGLSSGTISVSTYRILFGGDLNLRLHYWSWDNSRLVFLLGGRHLQLEESLRISMASQDIPFEGFLGNEFFIADTYHTRNRFYGGQVGAEYEYRLGPTFLQVTGKLAAGTVRQTLRANGQSQVLERDTGILTVDADSGLYNYPDNVGKFKKARFAVVPEANLKLGLEINQFMRFSVGYNFLYISSVIRPAGEVNQAVNIQPVGADTVIEPAAPRPPLNSLNFWAHGVDFSLKFSF